MKLTIEQELQIERVRIARETLRERQTFGLEALRRKLDEELAGLTRDMDIEVRKAHDMGIPKRQIHIRGLGTQAPVTLAQSLARTEGVMFAPAELPTDALAARYALTEAGTLRVTLTPEELEIAAQRVNYDAQAAGPAPATAEFTLSPRGRLDAIGGNTIPGTYERHPVIAWAYEAQNEAEALAWWQERTTAAQIAA